MKVSDIFQYHVGSSETLADIVAKENVTSVQKKSLFLILMKYKNIKKGAEYLLINQVYVDAFCVSDSFLV